MSGRKTSGVLQSITNFFFTRKRKIGGKIEKDEPTPKITRAHLVPATQRPKVSTPPTLNNDLFCKLPREMLWVLFKQMDLKTLFKVYSLSHKLQFEVKQFVSSHQHIDYIAGNFPDLSYHEQTCLVQILVEILFENHGRNRENNAVEWFKKAYSHRYQLNLPIFFDQILTTFSMNEFEHFFDHLYRHWFSNDVQSYIESRINGIPNKRMEKSLMDRFVRTFYNRRQNRYERAVIISLFLRQEQDPRKHFVMSQLLFGPHTYRGINSYIDFDGLEDGDGDSLTVANELDGFPELFNMLNELRNRTSRPRLRWSRAQMFLILEDVTTQPLWSMSNFARLLLVCPFLAITTSIIRCRNRLYEDAAFVLYHLLLLCESHANSLDLLLQIMKELDKPAAENLKNLVIDATTSESRTGSEKKNRNIYEVVQEAFDRTFKPKPKKP